HQVSLLFLMDWSASIRRNHAGPRYRDPRQLARGSGEVACNRILSRSTPARENTSGGDKLLGAARAGAGLVAGRPSIGRGGEAAGGRVGSGPDRSSSSPANCTPTGSRITRLGPASTSPATSALSPRFSAIRTT